MDKSKIQKEKGFTLVEVIVVMAVFLLVTAVTIAIFISIVQSQRRILTQEQLLSQVSYAMEYMSKGLRMSKKDVLGVCLIDEYSGTNYTYLYTKPSEGGEYTGVKFVNQSNNDACQEFYLYQSGDNYVIEEVRNENSVPLTSNKFNVDYLRFKISGTTGVDGGGYGAPNEAYPNQQPRITTIVGFKMPNDENQPEIKIQTTVSQRNLNVQ